MAFTIPIDIVSAEARIFYGKGEVILVPGIMGEMGIVPGHSQLLSFLKPGPVRIVNEGNEEVYYVSGGFVEVQPDKVTILADVAERAKDLDEAEALEAKRQAEQLLSDKQADVDYATAIMELSKAVAQLQAIRRIKKKY